MKKFLIIQTAFIGDVILATPIVEKLHESCPKSTIDFLLKKGTEGLLAGHPFINNVYVWDKKNRKYLNLWKLLKAIRKEKYDYVINLHRFMSTGLLTVFSGAKQTIGFNKNPMSLFYSCRYEHIITDKNNQVHEVDRNLTLISRLVTLTNRVMPRLYPSQSDYNKVNVHGEYVTISPRSVWFTKQYPLDQWVGVINQLNPHLLIYLLGGKADEESCQWIKNHSTHPNIIVMAGKLSFLESAALMKNGKMNYVIDSSPLHLASAVDAPVAAVFCSTVPSYGFGPLSSVKRIIETSEILPCRPCGLHGHKQCPEKHFKCAEIPPDRFLILSD